MTIQDDGLPGYVLKLYLAGAQSAAADTVERIRQWCAARSIPLVFNTIDVLAEPELAMSAGIFATPSLVRESPFPSRRVLGDLSDTELVMRLLQMPGSES